jgi:hypothetical protein
MTNTVHITVLLHNTTQPERTESYPEYRGNMVTPTGLHGVTATLVRICSTKNLQVQGVPFIMFVIIADTSSLCWGTRYEADIG